jgi:putative DNA primase/helicase
MNQATQGNGQLVQLLRAYLKAVVTSRADLQRFLELIGNGGSGKGTFTRLAQALVGHHNTAVTTLEQLEKNRFETAAIYGKKLLLITDSDKYGGEVSTLKAITGGDPIRFEKKNVQQCKAFTPTCMVIISANEPPQSTDYTSGLKRRRLTVPFKLQVEPSQRRDLDVEFKPYRAGLLEWVLTVPDEEMQQLIVNTTESVFSARNWEIEMLLDTNPIAQWFDHSVVLATGEKTYVGLKNQNPEKYLYASYCHYMEGSGQRSCALNRFSRLLQDLTVNQLKLKLIQKGSDRVGTYFPNITLRSGRYLTLPRPITGELDTPPDDPPDNPPPPTPPDSPPPATPSGDVSGDVSVTYAATYQTLTSNECDVCDVSFQLQSQVEKNDDEISLATPIAAENEISGSHASPCVTIESGTGFQPPQPCVTQTSHTSPTSPTTEPLKVGDQVVYTNPDNFLSFRKFENLPMLITAFDPLAYLAICKLPNNTEKSFNVLTLRKTAQAQKTFRIGAHVQWRQLTGVIVAATQKKGYWLVDFGVQAKSSIPAPTGAISQSQLRLL